MAVDGAPDELPPVIGEFERLLTGGRLRRVRSARSERFAYYERTRAAYAIVSTGERRYWGNLILKKGAIPPEGDGGLMQIDAHQHFWRVEPRRLRLADAGRSPGHLPRFRPRRPGAAAGGGGRRADRAGAGRADRGGDGVPAGDRACDAVRGRRGRLGRLRGAGRGGDGSRRWRPIRSCWACGPMLQDLDDDAWILRPGARAGAGRDARRQASRFDALVTPRHLPHLGSTAAAAAGPEGGDRSRRQAGHRRAAR